MKLGRYIGAILIAVATVVCLTVVPAHALAVPSAPSLATPIIDQTNTLSQEDITRLAAQIATSRETKSYQIGILMIPTLGTDEYLEGYSLKVARAWGIGEQGKDNGALILVVKNDRKMRIEVGRGLEGDLTDVRASRIIRDVLTPAFRKGDFAGGLEEAVDSIQKAISAQADPKLEAAASTDKTSFGSWAELGFFILVGALSVLSWVASMLGRSKSWWAGGIIGLGLGLVVALLFSWAFWTILLAVGITLFGFLFDFLVSRDYARHKSQGTLPSWWAGGGSVGGGDGGWSSGGGGSFGGGDFSGGGSSGSW